MRLLWLPDVLAEAGLPVRTLPGWQQRGRDLAQVRGFVWHDTVTTRAWTDARVEALLRDGRPGVPGPLSQLGMDRNGVLVVVAAGRSNHNGYGRWGNLSVGLEVFAAGGLRGQEEPWNAVQRDHAARAAAAVLGRLGMDERRAEGHKEQDPTRKIDPYGVDPDRLRAETGRYLRGTPSKEWDEMATKDEVKAALREVMTEQTVLGQADGKQWVWHKAAGQAVHIKTSDDFTRLRRSFPHVGDIDLAGLEVIA